jgi:dipeptidyl aminopeptidase/acylaminoacyl peptidase
MTHQDLIAGARFSPDGRLVATISHDRTARLWDTETGLPVSEPLPHLVRVESAAFSPDGRWLATGTAGGSVHLWEVPELPSRTPAWLPELVEAVVRQRLNEFNHIEPVPPSALAEVKEAIERDPSNEKLRRWARWFLAETATRTLSPSSEMTVSDYVRRRVEEDTLESLQEATRLSATNALAFARMARRLLATNQADQTVPENAEWFSRYAANLAPNDPEVDKSGRPWWRKYGRPPVCGRHQPRLSRNNVDGNRRTKRLLPWWKWHDPSPLAFRPEGLSITTSLDPR